MDTEIGAFDAKTKFSEILRKVDQGERFTVTLRGRPVAQVIPVQRAPSSPTQDAIEAAYARLRNPTIHGIAHDQIRAAIEEGRR